MNTIYEYFSIILNMYIFNVFLCLTYQHSPIFTKKKKIKKKRDKKKSNKRNKNKKKESNIKKGNINIYNIFILPYI